MIGAWRVAGVPRGARCGFPAGVFVRARVQTFLELGRLGQLAGVDFDVVEELLGHRQVALLDRQVQPLLGQWEI